MVTYQVNVFANVSSPFYFILRHFRINELLFFFARSSSCLNLVYFAWYRVQDQYFSLTNRKDEIRLVTRTIFTCHKVHEKGNGSFIMGWRLYNATALNMWFIISRPNCMCAYYENPNWCSFYKRSLFELVIWPCSCNVRNLLFALIDSTTRKYVTIVIIRWIGRRG